MANEKPEGKINNEELETKKQFEQEMIERKRFLCNGDRLLTYEEFTEDSGGVPLFDNFEHVLFKKNGVGGEVMAKFIEQNPELWKQLMEAYDKAWEGRRAMETEIMAGKFKPEKYKALNGKGHLMVPSHHLIYEAYCKLHELFTEEYRKRVREHSVNPDAEVPTANTLLFSTTW